MAPNRRVVLLAIAGLCLQAADTGLPPRASAADYAVHRSVPDAEIAAERLKADRVTKTFSSEIARDYVVIEVAVYPRNGTIIDVQLSDFALRFAGQQETHPDTPEEASAPLREAPGIKRPVEVTSETGVVVSTQKDPVTGRRTTDVGTYEATGVAVGNPQSNPLPSPSHGPDPRVLEDKLQAKALAEGKTDKAIAGYLYFPRPPKKPSNNLLELVYSKNSASLYLRFPAK
jgi:hypothetical protein